MEKKYIDYALEKLKELLDIPSPTGYTSDVANKVCADFKEMGYDARVTNKGGVFVDLGENKGGDGIILSAHVDTLGAMVSQIKPNGRLSVVPLGSLNANNVETEFCTVVTKNGKKICGTFQLANASVHVNKDYGTAVRSFSNIEIVLDEPVRSAADVEKLGIAPCDIVCVEPRTVITPSGYIKSRFLDDKLSAAMFYAVAKYMKDNSVIPERHMYMHFTVYEEVGHGAGIIPPTGVTEVLGVDMGCVGDGLNCTEEQVSICAKDSVSPSSYDVVCRLKKLCEDNDIDHAVDIYPYYSSDCDVMVRAYDLKHCLIGAGVYASHGYERSHVKGVENTLSLIEAYLLK